MPAPHTDLFERIDLRLLDADLTAAELQSRCEQAIQLRFASVCVPGSRIAQARSWLEDSSVKVAAAVGFPFGTNLADTKRFETEAAIDEGAQAIDVTLNIALLKETNATLLLRELRDIVEAADERPVTVSVDTRRLDREQLNRACELIGESGAVFLGASTEFPPGIVSPETIRLLREFAPKEIQVSAAGEILDAQAAQALADAGAARLGITPAGAGWLLASR